MVETAEGRPQLPEARSQFAAVQSGQERVDQTLAGAIFDRSDIALKEDIGFAFDQGVEDRWRQGRGPRRDFSELGNDPAGPVIWVLNAQ